MISKYKHSNHLQYLKYDQLSILDQKNTFIDTEPTNGLNENVSHSSNWIFGT